MTAVPILCFHAVTPDTTGPLSPWAMTPARFDEHLDAIADAGYRPVALADLVRRIHDEHLPAPEGAVVLTVDDGYADVADTIWPRLAARGWPATLFVSTALVGGRFLGRPMLDRSQVTELASAGLGMGAHGHRHLALDIVDLGTASDEIRRGRDLLEDWTNRPVTSLAYPHGFHDKRVRQLVIDAGFDHACAVKQALSSPADDRFALARIMPTGAETAPELQARLRGHRTPVANGGRERLRTTAFRYVRQVRAGVARRQVAA